jgi:hypothetical protein
MGNAKDEDSHNKHFDKKVDALEIEMLNPMPVGSSNSNGPSQMSQRIDQFLTLVRLYMEMYPKVTMAVAGVVGLILMKLLFFRPRGQTLYIPPHLKNHYGDLQSYYDLKMSKIDHWCLRGGDDNCRCDDPTEGVSREEVNGWMVSFQQNKQVAKDAPKDLDVVFLGDDFTQAWTGKSLLKPLLGGNQIAKSFNQTFQRSRGAFVDGLPLGISGDSVSQNTILYTFGCMRVLFCCLWITIIEKITRVLLAKKAAFFTSVNVIDDDDDVLYQKELFSAFQSERTAL